MGDHSGGRRMPFPVEGVIFDYDARVPMSDGLYLHINLFRPDVGAQVPAIITHGVYGKDVHWAAAAPYRQAWKMLRRKLPGLSDKSTLAFMRWEMPDPERWAPMGYAVIHADARGSGKTSGDLDILSPREIEDFKELIEWVAAQSWCNGRVGLMGISYYAITQWRVAALKPKGLSAIMPWEGAFDHYRDISAQGGIPSSFFARNWFRRQVAANAYGTRNSNLRDAVTGGPAIGCDDQTKPQELTDLDALIRDHPFDDAFHRGRTPDPAEIEAPLLSVGNWGGSGLHLRGNIEGFLAAGSRQKWLRLHSGDHFSPFYREESLDLQRRFLDRFLKGEDNGWQREPKIEFVVRDPRGRDRRRVADAWPLPETRWTKLWLDAANARLANETPPEPAAATYVPDSSGVTFVRPAQNEDFEIAGPIAVRLWVRPAHQDMDIFVVLRVLDPAGRDVTFEGANSPRQAIAHGWLRLSHRQTNGDRSTAWRPYHKHDAPALVEAGKDYPVEVEIWPTSVVVPAGYRLALTVLARDFVFPGWRNIFASLAARLFDRLPLISGLIMQGSAPFLHDSRDRSRFGGAQTILSGGEHDSHIVLPIILSTPKPSEGPAGDARSPDE